VNEDQPNDNQPNDKQPNDNRVKIDKPNDFWPNHNRENPIWPNKWIQCCYIVMCPLSFWQGVVWCFDVWQNVAAFLIFQINQQEN
jgi:hypothetical protein